MLLFDKILRTVPAAEQPSARQELIDSPGRTIIEIFGNELPAQAVYFMQLNLIQAFLGLGLELLRVYPCLYAALRRLLAPRRLSPRERREAWLGLPPLCAPGPLDRAGVASDAMLMFVVLLSYAPLFPACAFAMLACFGAFALAYRNQCAFVYDPAQGETGGRLWPHAARCVLTSAWIGQVMVMAVLSLKQGTAQASRGRERERILSVLERRSPLDTLLRCNEESRRRHLQARFPVFRFNITCPYMSGMAAD
jgi:hypothetical protein